MIAGALVVMVALEVAEEVVVAALMVVTTLVREDVWVLVATVVKLQICINRQRVRLLWRILIILNL